MKVRFLRFKADAKFVRGTYFLPPPPPVYASTYSELMASFSYNDSLIVINFKSYPQEMFFFSLESIKKMKNFKLLVIYVRTY